MAEIRQWAHEDPLAAWQWFANRVDQLDHATATAAAKLILAAMAAQNPQSVATTMNSFLSVRDATGPFSSSDLPPLVVQALVDSGNLELAQRILEDWTHDSSAREIDASAYTVVALALAQNAPAEAGAWLKSLPATPTTRSAIVTFVEQWGSRDPVAALAWSESLEPDENQTLATNTVFGDWAQRDADAAAEWLAAHLAPSPTEADDDKVIALINRAATLQSDPTLALTWTRLIVDPKSRDTVEENILLRWARTDARAAFDYLSASPGFHAAATGKL